MNQTQSKVDRREWMSWRPTRREILHAAALTGIGGLLVPGSRQFAQAAPADTKKLIVHTDVPRNAEPPLPALVQSWLTPTESFYIRSHAANPSIDSAQFRLRVTGLVERELSLSLEELAAFPHVEAVATMTCAGNRRSEHSLIKPVKGVAWQAGAIGNARWSGVRLSDVLNKAGLKADARHVWFTGLDRIERSGGTIPFGGSIPIEKALLDTESMPGAILCTHMHGQPLTPDHGAPLRMVVPGYIGARSVKWLGQITVSNRPSDNHYVADAYKLVEHGNELEWAEQGPIYRFPINSVTCSVARAGTAAQATVRAAGYALPPGEAGTVLARVDVSADDGRSWTRARITSPVRDYCWVLWTAEVPVGPQATHLLVRATDSRGHRQPQSVDWNLKGYLFNAWHRTTLPQ